MTKSKSTARMIFDGSGSCCTGGYLCTGSDRKDLRYNLEDWKCYKIICCKSFIHFMWVLLPKLLNLKLERKTNLVY